MFALLLERDITKQVKSEEFEKYLNSKFLSNDDEKDEDNEFSEEDKNNLRIRRFMDCVCVCENNKINLLCDDERSLMYTMCNLKLAVLRLFHMPN